MRILLLSQFFDPEPSFKGLPFARMLRERGHDVHVLTGFPNYPGGKLYPGYRVRSVQRETLDGFPIRRVALYPSHDRSSIRRVANYTSFAASAALLGPLGLPRPDVVYAYCPPATIGIPARAVSLWTGAPYVLDVQDLWPDTVATTGMMRSPALLRVLGAFCTSVYRRAAHVAVLSEGFRRTFVERGHAPERVSVIRNWADESVPVLAAADPSVRQQLGIGADRFVVMFAGTMGVAQALDAVLEAARGVVTRVPSALFVFVGGGIERERLAAEAAGIPNVRFLERQPPSAMPPLLAMADVQLVHLMDSPLFRITIPSKTQAALRAGRPILLGVEGDAADLVRAAGAGVVVPAHDPEALADAVARLAALPAAEREAMGQAGRRYYDEHLSMARGVTEFERVFTRVARASALRGAGDSVHRLP